MSDTVPSAATATEQTDATAESITNTIEIAASPERVFAALTDPQELAAWWGSDDAYRTHDWRVDARTDGEWSARTTDRSGNEGSIRGVYTVVDPPNSLESTWRASWDGEVVTTVRYDLSPIVIDDSPATRLTVTHTGFTGSVACALSSAAQPVILGELLATRTRPRSVRGLITCVA